MMKLFRILFTAVISVTMLTVYQGGAAASGKSRLSESIPYGDASITGQFVQLLGDRPTKFQEYREIVSGPQAQDEALMVSPPNSPLYSYFEGFNLFRRDQSVFVEFGKVGSYKAAFEFNQIPHKYSRYASTIEQDISTGNYVVDTGTRTTLQGLNAAGQANQIRQLTSFSERDIEAKRNRYNWNFSAWLNKALQMDVKAGFETRDGLRKKGTGTYMRTGDLFEIRGIELPEPLKYQTLDFGARLTYAAPKSVTSLDWALSYFHNSAGVLEWDNPFRISDSAATGAAGASNRGNFARGRVGLYPDNIANTITLSQAWTLPYKTNFTGSLSYGVYFQDDNFLPYTTNSAINTLATFPVNDTSHLPQESLEGLSNAISANFNIINRAIDHLKAKLYMKFYDYINNTEAITFPGYAAYGDSYWLTQITGDFITNKPPSFIDLKTGIKLDYELTKNVSLNTGYEYKYRNLKNRQVSDINEYTFKNGIEIRPWSNLKIEGGYSYGWRNYMGDYIYHREQPDARMFDEANKVRNQVDARVEVTPGERLTLGASGMWRRDNYKSGYGLKRSDGQNLSFDAEYAPSDNYSLYTYYSHDRGTFDIASIAKSSTPWHTSNTWFSNTTENTNSLGTGVRYSFIPGRMNMDLGYSFSLATQKIDNSSLVPNPANPLTATTYDWPVVRSNLHEFKVQASYKIRRDMEFRAYYYAELYDLDDFAWDGLQPYMQGQTADNSTQYLWLDSRYSDYTAHVFGFTLKYVF